MAGKTSTATGIVKRLTKAVKKSKESSPTNIPKTKGNETVEYQRNVSPAGVRAIDRNQRTGVREYSSGSGTPSSSVQRGSQGERTRNVFSGLRARIEEAKDLQAKVNAGTATPAEKVAAKAMRNAIKDDMKRFGVTSDDAMSPKMAAQAEKIIEAFQNLTESGLAKGGMPKKKKGYMSGGMANGKKHSYVAGGYVTDMMGKKKK